MLKYTMSTKIETLGTCVLENVIRVMTSCGARIDQAYLPSKKRSLSVTISVSCTHRLLNLSNTLFMLQQFGWVGIEIKNPITISQLIRTQINLVWISFIIKKLKNEFKNQNLVFCNYLAASEHHLWGEVSSYQSTFQCALCSRLPMSPPTWTLVTCTVWES